MAKSGSKAQIGERGWGLGDEETGRLGDYQCQNLDDWIYRWGSEVVNLGLEIFDRDPSTLTQYPQAGYIVDLKLIVSFGGTGCRETIAVIDLKVSVVSKSQQNIDRLSSIESG